MASFTSILSDITQILALTPTILQLILAFEQIFAANGMNNTSGAAKKELMTATLKSAGVPDRLMPKAMQMNDDLVASLKQNGVLTTVAAQAVGTPSPAPPPAS